MIFLLVMDSEEDKRKIVILYEQYHRLMSKIACGILQNYGEVEDVLHDAFEKVAKNMKHIGDPYSKETRNFMAIIAKNTALDLYRKKKCRLEKEVDINKLNEDQTPCIYIADELDENAQILIEAIQKLPNKYREVLSLKFTNQYNNKEISQILNISETNVRQRIFRARKMLEDEMKKQQ